LKRLGCIGKIFLFSFFFFLTPVQGRAHGEVRLADKIQGLEKMIVPVGFLDINLYRDESSQCGRSPCQPTEIKFPGDRKNII